MKKLNLKQIITGSLLTVSIVCAGRLYAAAQDNNQIITGLNKIIEQGMLCKLPKTDLPIIITDAKLAMSAMAQAK